MRGLCDRGGVVIADLGREGRDQHQRLAHDLVDPVLIRADARDAVIGECHAGIAQQLHRLQHIIGHHRLINVQLKMALAARKSNGRVIAKHMRADLRHCLALGRVNLARHD